MLELRPLHAQVDQLGLRPVELRFRLRDIQIGRYAARNQADGSNPGADFIRVAMVHDKATTAEALHRIVAVLG